jgi:hypothetical protein
VTSYTAKSGKQQSTRHYHIGDDLLFLDEGDFAGRDVRIVE